MISNDASNDDLKGWYEDELAKIERLTRENKDSGAKRVERILFEKRNVKPFWCHYINSWCEIHPIKCYTLNYCKLK